MSEIKPLTTSETIRVCYDPPGPYWYSIDLTGVDLDDVDCIIPELEAGAEAFTWPEPVAGGRPSEYRERFCQDIILFFSRPLTELVHTRVVDGRRSKKGKLVYRTITTEKINNIPFFDEFARSIGASHDSVSRWAAAHPEFSVAHARAKELQKEFLINQTLAGRFNAQFAAFTAKNITDMRDITGHELSGPGGRSIPISQTGAGDALKKYTDEQLDKFLEKMPE